MRDRQTEDRIDEYLSRMRDGESEALALLYDCTCRPLYALCYSYFHHKQDSEDALSETYLKIQQEIARFSGQSGYAWMSTIARNICLNRLKRESRTVAVDFTDEACINAYGISEVAEESSVDAERDIATVAREVLSKTEFQILIQHAVSERRFREIARDLGRLETTVRWQYHQALKKVRAACERRGITG